MVKKQRIISQLVTREKADLPLTTICNTNIRIMVDRAILLRFTRWRWWWGQGWAIRDFCKCWAAFFGKQIRAETAILIWVVDKIGSTGSFGRVSWGTTIIIRIIFLSDRAGGIGASVWTVCELAFIQRHAHESRWGFNRIITDRTSATDSVVNRQTTNGYNFLIALWTWMRRQLRVY